MNMMGENIWWVGGNEQVRGEEGGGLLGNEFFVKSSWSTMNSYMNYIPAALRAAAP